MPMGVLPVCFSATHKHSDDDCGLCVALGVGPGSSGRTPGAPNSDQGKSWHVVLHHDPSLLNLSLSLLFGYCYAVLGEISRCPLMCMTIRNASFLVVSSLAKTKPYVKNPMWKSILPRTRKSILAVLTHLATGQPCELLPSFPVYSTFSIRTAFPFWPYLSTEHKRRWD